jgi:hypothetical protein
MCIIRQVSYTKCGHKGQISVERCGVFLRNRRCRGREHIREDVRVDGLCPRCQLRDFDEY